MRNPLRRKKSLVPGEPRSGITTVTGVPSRANLHEGTSASYAELYRSSPAVQAVVRFLADNVSQLPLHGFMREGERGRKRLPPRDPLELVLAQPNARTPGSQFIRDLVADVALYGNHFSLLVRDDDDRVGALVRVPPASVSMLSLDTTEPAAFRVQFGVGSKEYGPDDLMHVRTYNPADSRIGVSPLEALRGVLAEDAAAVRHRAYFWRNAARNEGVIERPADAPEWDQDTRDRFREDWQAMHTGEGGGKTAILEDGMAYKPHAFSPKDSEYIASRRLSLEIVAAVFGVPLQLIAQGDRNVAEARRVLLQEVLPPWTSLIAAELNSSLVPAVSGEQAVFGRIFVEFDLRGKLAGSFKEQSDGLETAVGGPYMTPNEARRLQNLPDVEGGDALYRATGG